MSDDVKHRTSATAAGGRDRRTRTEDGKLDLQLTILKELGGADGEGANPEQLFAAGYAACFLSAVKGASQKLHVRVPSEANVTATVWHRHDSDGKFGLDVDLRVSLAGIDQSLAHQVVELAHQICPYSKATRNNIGPRSRDLRRTFKR